MPKFFKSLFVLLLICSAFLTGCGSAVPTVKPFKMDIQQGNVVTSKMLLQLKPGMTKSQVKFIMGTPLMVDSFHSNRWDYFYQMRQAGKIKEQRRVILDFENELLARVRGDVVPEGTAGADSGTAAGAASLPKSIEPKPKEKGLLEKLKFWQGDEKAVVTPETAKPVAPKPEAAPALADKPEIDLRKPANDAPVGDAPSVLAVPIGDVAPSVPVPSVAVSAPSAPEPAVAAPVEVPVVEVNKVAPPPAETPQVEPLKIEPAKVEPPKALPIEPAESIKTAPVEVAPEVKAKKVAEPPPPPEEDPGYFEKMLEKIGF